MSITRESFGKLRDGREVEKFTLTNKNGVRLCVSNYGGLLLSLEVPDKDGNMADILLGKKGIKGYIAGHPFFGAITGRVAGRITGGKFTLDGTTYELEKNNGENALHGGTDGFDKQVWEPTALEEDGASVLKLHYLDPDGHNGFPGNLDGTVTYTLTDDNELVIDYAFTTDKATPLAVTNHAYFNLKGEANGNILGHEFQILADSYAVADGEMTLTGEVRSVEGQANDFRQPVILRERIAGMHKKHGDNYFFEGGRTDEPRLVVRIREPESGRVLECLTTEPGMQLYTSAMIEEEVVTGKHGVYQLHAGFCLETQACPEGINKPDTLGDIVLRPGQDFTSRTIFRFSAE
ncbi:aldose epimerase family protein [Ruficoccus sp. ZRK36]|uniref:aldose epimerase family protein n=1 Tax=Ruficoccus sp. ZRK36 TaxID=2866311 RepID=UPI001C7373A6|nr:aldose epimerase family protein [Ruficoccus sp. ZRK36]QYY36127.1 galactose mutarotase [Ruficoccus sp. ZRK36]